MTPTPPSTSSSVGAHSPEGQYRVVRKRNRVPLSCAPCRQRKLKCNRSHPCENCVKRGDAASCTYAQPGSRKKSSANQSSSTSPDDMQNRIDRLENLVLSLMTNGSQAAGPAAAAAALSGHDSVGSGQNYQDVEIDEDVDGQNEESDTEAVTKSFGIMKVDNNKSMYISEAHWASVLNDIAEVRQFFQNSKKQYEEQAQKIQATRPETDTTTMLLFGSVKAPSKAEILSSFPSRYIADMLIARFFNNRDHGPDILHVPTFQKDYNEHWKNPSASCPVWIGMLYAMMRLAMLSYYHDGEEPPEFKGKSLDMSKSFRHLMCQCLILADYTKPYPYLIETLVLHMHADFSETNEANIAIWVLVGIIARLAMRMGYHRDSKMFPNITPYQGEMRRRVWAYLRQADLLFSFQVGMPSMLRPGDTDTELPRNLFDEDFGPDSKEIPPSRPNEQATPVSYMIAKSRLSVVFGRVIEHTSLVKNAPYEVVIDIDAELRRARDMIPEHLRVLPFDECTIESTDSILMRYYVESVYHKAQVVLHRRYIGRSRENPRFTHSRRTCIDSSMELLRYQAIFYNQKLPGGRLLSKIRDNSINNSNYLLSATVICLDLYQSMQLQAAGRPSGDVYIWGRERRDEMLAAIRQARDIWQAQSDESMESWKAAGMMTVMLEKLNVTPAPPSGDMNGTPSMLDVPDEKQSAAMTLGLLSSGMSPGDTGTGFTDPFKSPDSVLSPTALGGTSSDTMGFSSPFNMLGQMPDMQLDWNAWDSYIGNTSLDNNNSSNNPLWPMFDLSSQMISPMPPPSSSSSQPTPSTSATTPGTGNRSTSSAENIRSRIRLPGVLPSDTGMAYDPTNPSFFMAGPNGNKID
ncbi:C6 transcription factor, putative [Talaromyces stipitatus ATCC 10500]|uniref:C6 transcription factor, putative n=1 Tax=Talaromyces stipitatus (strain ATCC 10500 / CBS 375.48 / QM 6759 / NRRL 1006) TaxID=441959 RepID=B8MQK9_TALSN|nr:C6 transcription factor, putative [Talaromyces stipitatus ATCC 10500]EED13411.1 C6 transcription factor, putative [Talaromyces stipitatus ATCC 10500]